MELGYIHDDILIDYLYEMNLHRNPHSYFKQFKVLCIHTKNGISKPYIIDSINSEYKIYDNTGTPYGCSLPYRTDKYDFEDGYRMYEVNISNLEMIKNKFDKHR